MNADIFLTMSYCELHSYHSLKFFVAVYWVRGPVKGGRRIRGPAHQGAESSISAVGDRCINRTKNNQNIDISTKSDDLWYKVVPETVQNSDQCYEIVPDSDILVRSRTRNSQQQRPMVRNRTGNKKNSNLATKSYKKQAKRTA